MKVLRKKNYIKKGQALCSIILIQLQHHSFKDEMRHLSGSVNLHRVLIHFVKGSNAYLETERTLKCSVSMLRVVDPGVGSNSIIFLLKTMNATARSGYSQFLLRTCRYIS